MFTGIVEELGTVAAVEDQGDAVRLTIAATAVLEDAALGDSVSVNGCCLTVADGLDHRPTDLVHRRRDARDAGQDGRRRPDAGRPGEPRARGHADHPARRAHRAGPRRRHRRGTAPYPSASTGSWSRWWLPADLLRYLVPKGSITVDGISLTVVDVLADGFTVSLIPETLARTTLGFRQPGDG